jgi:hypothetical protein
MVPWSWSHQVGMLQLKRLLGTQGGRRAHSEQSHIVLQLSSKDSCRRCSVLGYSTLSTTYLQHPRFHPVCYPGHLQCPIYILLHIPRLATSSIPGSTQSVTG